MSLYELVVRVLMARLESKPSSGKNFEQVDSAFKLLKTLVEETSMEALSGPQKEILKFQVEQVHNTYFKELKLSHQYVPPKVLPSLMVLAIECKPAKESMVADGALSSFLSVLDLFHVLSIVPEWSSTVAQVVFYFNEFPLNHSYRLYSPRSCIPPTEPS